MADQSNPIPPSGYLQVPQIPLPGTPPPPQGLTPDLQRSSQELAQAQDVIRSGEVENSARVESIPELVEPGPITNSTPDYMFVNPNYLTQPNRHNEDEDVLMEDLLMDETLAGTEFMHDIGLPCGQPFCLLCGGAEGLNDGPQPWGLPTPPPETPVHHHPVPLPLNFTYIPEVDNFFFETPSNTATELVYPSWIVTEQDRQQYRTGMIARQLDEQANPRQQTTVESTAASSAHQPQPAVSQTSQGPAQSAQNVQTQDSTQSPHIPDNSSSPYVYMVTERDLPLGYWKPHYALPGSLQFMPIEFSYDKPVKPGSAAPILIDHVEKPAMDVYIITKDGNPLGRWVTFAVPSSLKQAFPAKFAYRDPESTESSSQPRPRSHSSRTSHSHHRSRSGRNPYLSRKAEKERKKRREERRLGQNKAAMERRRATVEELLEEHRAAEIERLTGYRESCVRHPMSI
ncbi:hypothetical protein RBB50_008500 [Rhinocladiella similis]